MRTANLRFQIASVAVAFFAGPLRGEDIRISLDKPGDSHVRPFIDRRGFAIEVEAEGNLQKLEPTTIRIETQQKGQWVDPKLDVGRYLKHEFDAENPREVRIESTLKFELAAGEKRFVQERDAIQKEVQKRVAGKDQAAQIRARTQILTERIAEIRSENMKAGADPRGRATPHAPPLPRPAVNFDKPEALERILKEQCCWRGVAEAFKATGFPPPDDKEHPEFAAAQAMAEEMQKSLMGINLNPRYLSQGQYQALSKGHHYQFSVRFVPELPSASVDRLWNTAPGVRLSEGLVKRAQLEGSLDRQRGQTVEWWRVDCDAFPDVRVQMIKGDGDCFWTWVEGPQAGTRYIRVLLHSPGTRYRLNLSLSGATKGQELTLFDGPVNAPAQAPF